MNIILIGPPGVGKGTQAALLEAHYGIHPYSSGVIFRAEIEAGTDLGKLAKRYIDDGRLVPDGVTIEMMAKKLCSVEARRDGFMLDGFPRTVRQAEALDKILVEEGVHLDAVVSLEVADDILVSRLSGRLGCTKCGAIYHQTNKPPKRDWICDQCNSPLFVRSDDTEEAIRERLNIFRENTKPVIDHYAAQGLVRSILADRAPDAVLQEIIEAVGPK